MSTVSTTSSDAWTLFTLNRGSYRAKLGQVAIDWLKIENSVKSNESMYVYSMKLHCAFETLLLSTYDDLDKSPKFIQLGSLQPWQMMVRPYE